VITYKLANLTKSADSQTDVNGEEEPFTPVSTGQLSHSFDNTEIADTTFLVDLEYTSTESKRQTWKGIEVEPGEKELINFISAQQNSTTGLVFGK